MILVVVLIIIAIFWWHYNDRKNSSRDPPGPKRIPIFGNFLQVATLSRRTAEAFKTLAKKYGDIMSIRLGSTDYIVLSKYEIMKELQARSELVGRDHAETYERNMKTNLGIIWSDGDNWDTMRRFTLKSFKKFGFTRSAELEIFILDEFDSFKASVCEIISKKEDSLVTLKYFFELSALNIIWKYSTGKQFSYSDHYIQYIIQSSNQLLQDMTIGRLPHALPILKKIFPTWSGKNREMRCITDLHKFLNEEIGMSAVKPKNEDGETEYFADDFLQKIETGKNETMEDSVFKRENLIIALLDFFQAGMAGVSGTLDFAVYYLMLNPGVQRKMHEEISDKIPEGIRPSLADKERMPYTEATMLEILRLGTVFPVPLARQIIKDFTYNGYHFRKGVLVLANIHCMMMRDDLWGDQDNFRPERFIKPDGTLDKELCAKVSSFGHGSRRCLGDQLALATVFLFLVSLVQQMTFSSDKIRNLNEKPQYGLVMHPPPYEVRIDLRSRSS